MASCTVCKHPELALINNGLQVGMEYANLAARFELTPDALARHKAAHVDHVAVSGVDAQQLIRELQDNLKIAKGLIELTEGRERLDALREVRQTSEALAKLTGAYQRTDPKHLLPWWSKIKQAILKALKDHPEARMAVLVAIEELQASE